MNMAPKVRPLWQRILITFALCGLMVWKLLRLPTFFLPRAIRSIINNWTYEMFGVMIRSRVLRASIDQTCRFKSPPSYEPLLRVEPQYQLTCDQIKSFCDRGYLGPFDAFRPEQMRQFRQKLIDVEDTDSRTYGWKTPRDRHFEMPEMLEMMKHPAITQRVAQLLGPDLNCWRSQIFYKMAGAERIQWHQASTFMVEDYLDPAIFPADRDALFQITVWVAVDRSTRENGCLEFACGTHDSIKTIKFGGTEGFYKANFSLECDFDDVEIAQVEAQPGQFIIFTERCVHGSPPNNTEHDRLAFNFRVIPTNVPVYIDKKYYRSVYNGGKYFLDNWGVVPLKGQDQHRLSKLWDPERHLPPLPQPAPPANAA